MTKQEAWKLKNSQEVLDCLKDLYEMVEHVCPDAVDNHSIFTHVMDTAQAVLKKHGNH